jgi:hypothetical protein
VIAARQRAEDDFLAFTKQARAARVVEEKRWAAAEKAVMAEEFAAALGANEVSENLEDEEEGACGVRRRGVQKKR